MKIPEISKERIDKSEADTSPGTTKADKKAHAFIKGKEVTQAFEIRLPKSLHKFLRHYAVDNETTMNKAIVTLVKKLEDGTIVL